MFRAVPNVVEVTMEYSASGGPPINNRLYVRDTAAGWTVAKLDALCADISAWWEANARPTIVAAWVLAAIHARDLGTQFGATFTRAVALAGTRAGTPAPAAVAALVHYQGDPGAAPRRGTLFAGGVAEADIDANALTGAYALEVQAAYDALRGFPGFAGTQALVIVSRHSGSALVDLPPRQGEATGERRRKATPRAQGVSNTIAGTVVPTRYGIVKSRRPSPL